MRVPVLGGAVGTSYWVQGGRLRSVRYIEVSGWGRSIRWNDWPDLDLAVRWEQRRRQKELGE